MFSPLVIDSDAFLDMSSTAQALYFHLGMRADDDGFVGNPKKIQRMVGGNDDDLKILLAKRFILTFESGVIVIKHWRINNLVRKDWYRPTVYIEEKEQLQIKENGAYTEFVNENTTTRSRRLGKVRLGKDSIGKEREREGTDSPSPTLISENKIPEDNNTSEINSIPAEGDIQKSQNSHETCVIKELLLLCHQKIGMMPPKVSGMWDFTPSAINTIKEKIKEFKAERLMMAIVGFSENKFNMEKNSKMGIGWFFKDSTRLENYINFYKTRPNGNTRSEEDVKIDIDDFNEAIFSLEFPEEAKKREEIKREREELKNDGAEYVDEN